MADRGEYRSIRRVLLDGPDFQQLSERARWIFVALKLNAGAAGLELHYPEALLIELAQQTGAPTPAIAAALEELEARGWIRRERHLVWIVGHLANDPHMAVSNYNHRKSLHRYLAGLPRLAIVAAFVHAHPDWFPTTDPTVEPLRWALAPDPTPPSSRSDGIPMASPIPSDSHPDTTAITEKEKEKERENETERENSGARARATAPPADTTEADAAAELRRLVRKLPEGVKPFLRHFYGPPAPLDRQLRVVRQLVESLGAGTRPPGRETGTVLAYSPDRLVAKCNEVIAEPPRDPDKAVVVLLRKLGDTSDLAVRREQEAQRAKAEEQLPPIDRAAAEAWLKTRPDVAAEITAELAQLGHTDPESPLTATVRNTLVLRRYRQEPPTNPNAGAAA